MTCGCCGKDKPELVSVLIARSKNLKKEFNEDLAYRFETIRVCLPCLTVGVAVASTHRDVNKKLRETWNLNRVED